jgi:hypothetical protein
LGGSLEFSLGFSGVLHRRRRFFRSFGGFLRSESFPKVLSAILTGFKARKGLLRLWKNHFYRLDWSVKSWFSSPTKIAESTDSFQCMDVDLDQFVDSWHSLFFTHYPAMLSSNNDYWKLKHRLVNIRHTF